jgi:hypothetical protein
MDCPFPKFTNVIPPANHAAPLTFGSEEAHTYGTGDDGPGFQQKIIDEARRLVLQGTTVILCNFANPALVTAYAQLIHNDVGAQDLRWFTYTYRSPSTLSEAYQLTVLPGAWNTHVTQCPQTIMTDWLAVGGDNNATAQEFFVRKPALTAADRAYARLHDRTESARQDAEKEWVYQDDEDDDVSDTDMVDDRDALKD